MICHQKLIDDYMGRFRLVRRKPVANRHKTNHKAYMTGVDDGRHISLSRQLKDNTFKRIKNMGFVNRLITWIMDRLSVEVDPDAEWF